MGSWGGFVFLNPDPAAESLESFLGVLPELFARWPLEHRYVRAHVTKVVNANYRENYPRLVTIKSKYDPTNLFRLNANVQPNA